MKYAAMILLLMTSVAFADGEGGVWKELKISRPIQELKTRKPITEEEISKLRPSEENKKWFLERGYKLNNNRMCCGFIDVNQLRSWTDDAKPVKTERIVPVAKPEQFNEIDAQAEDPQQKWLRLRGDKTFAEDNFCARYHMHAVSSKNGKGWRCRK
jgi:hypothetical protein